MGAGVIFIGACTCFRWAGCMAAAASDLRFFPFSGQFGPDNFQKNASESDRVKP